MKKILLAVMAIMFVASVASAASIVGSKHDMRTYFSNGTQQVCVYCHTPHMANGETTDPLWNHSLSSVTSYGVYSSVTMNATPTELAGSGQTGVLCMSCHDGTVAVNSVWNDSNDGGVGTTLSGSQTALNASAMISTNANLGQDLTNDHPVNFDYATSAAGDTAIRSTPTGSVVLFGGTVQCGSCHNVHDPANTPFLRQNNDGSALCLACHDK